MNIHYENDLRFRLNLKDSSGNVVIPTWDFELQFFVTSTGSKKTATQINGVMTNMKIIDSHLWVFLNNTNFGIGELQCKFINLMTDPDFSDDNRKQIIANETGITLVEGNGDDNTTIDVDMMIDYAIVDMYEMAVKKGYTGTKEDYITALSDMPAAVKAATDATSNLNVTIKNAEDATKSANDTNSSIEDAEKLRVKAEESRVIAENNRELSFSDSKSACDKATDASINQTSICKNETDKTIALEISVGENETKRQSAEVTRNNNESIRIENEIVRNSSEETRTNSEKARIDSENIRKESELERIESESSRSLNEQSRIDAENIRVEAENTRLSNENTRKQSEIQRVSNEDNRVDAEKLRVDAENARVISENSRIDAEKLRVQEETKRESDFSASKEACDTATANCNTLIEEIQLGKADYYVAGWNPSNLSPDTIKSYGDVNFMDKNRVWLIDTTDNADETTKPVGELMRNNFLRFVDGSFAPTVGITETMRAACDVALYLDATQTTKYCDAGAFNATTFYNTYGMSQKLYDASGNEVRILRPWETTETKYTINIGRLDKVYVCDGLGKSGTYWKGLFSKPVTWDGINTEDYPLAPTAIAPCPITTVGGKARNFFYLYKGESYCQSNQGINGLCTMFLVDRTYPRTQTVNQITNATYARANNADTTKSYPFAEGGYHALNAMIIGLEAKYGTNYIIKNFKSGISSNDSCSDETSYQANGGVKYRVTGSSTYKYCLIGANSDIAIDNTGKKADMSSIMNYYCPKEQCMESQMAASFAKETGVAENTEFTFYDTVYKYSNVSGAVGLTDGRMNVVVYRKVSQTFSAFDSTGAAVSYDVECNLRMSLFDGMNLSGDVFAYWGGGYEQVGTCTGTASPHFGDPVKCYLEPDQKKWLNDSTVTLNNLGTFNCEKYYKKIGEGTVLADSYVLKRMPYAAWKTEKGGSISTGQCYYGYDYNYWSAVLNQRVRIAARCRGYSATSACSPRSLDATHSVAITYLHLGGSAQVLIR